jgi:hypothetical protein
MPARVRPAPAVALVVLTLILALTLACGDTIVNLPTNPSALSATPTTTTPVVTKDVIEFHVTGNANGAKVKYSSSVEGLNQTTTTLPFQTLITTSGSSSFLFLEATATGYSVLVTNPFLAVQIFVNGQLFRESATTSAFNETVSVSGTYRR